MALKALDAATLSESVTVDGCKMKFTFRGAVLPAEERKVAYENWVLSKGLQELARAVREALDQGYFYCGLVEHFKENEGKSKWGAVREVLTRKGAIRTTTPCSVSR